MSLGLELHDYLVDKNRLISRSTFIEVLSR